MFFIAIIIFLLAMTQCKSFLIIDSSSKPLNIKVAVALTTIPPRFSSVHHTIRSWVMQTEPVSIIFIFIPPYYRRFKRKRIETEKSQDHVASLHKQLWDHADLRPFLENGKIHITFVEKDWGPITRVLGALYVLDRWENQYDYIDYWLFCDDDVGYDATVISIYQQKVQELYNTIHNNEQLNSIGLTLFAETYRLRIPLSVTHDNRMEMIPHIQGVDTYLVRQQHILNQTLSFPNILSYSSFRAMIEYIHRTCSSSFYQDDYVAAVLFALGKVQFMSVWENYRKLVHHVDNVSTSHFQMHMDQQVFQREKQTQECLPNLVHSILMNTTLIVGVEKQTEEVFISPIAP